MAMLAERASARSRIVAVLGPTNTGKTHFAMERLLGHASGMIGFPLRLLARENYDRAVRIKGAGQVALITGEEKIAPATARYFLCTVESMPIDRAVAFLGVDEIQMAADPDRGHVFTDRLLHARGDVETMFMGAETIRPLLRRLVPGIDLVSRPRFSTLSYAGERRLQRLPGRSAVVAFSAADVYAIAELLRRQRGGTGVVLGALSPRTRNAQVAMYQAGEVDYLVATDAIGMGLNMDINHVAFAATRKFDGRTPRALTPAELAQIAGRAGRHMNDGSFGTTADIGPLDAECAERIQSHCFDPLRFVYWRNAELAFTSLDALRASLARPPDRTGLVRAREADDEVVLAALARDPEIAALARGPEAVRLLWEVCQIPDFRKVMSETHARLLAHVYRALAGGAGRRLATAWIARQVDRLDRVDGDIDTLMQRIAHIRTWTYIAYRGDWVESPGHWQERTRAIEDRLSDALHDRLIQRFVDRGTAALAGRIRRHGALLAAVGGDGDVLVEGEPFGRLAGFRFIPDLVAESGGETAAARAVNGAVTSALRAEILARLRRLETDGDDAFALTEAADLTWRGARVARLAAGHHPLHPAVEPEATDLLDPAARERLRKPLAAWLARHLEVGLKPLFAARQAPLPAAARGLVYQLGEALGSLPRRRVAASLALLDAAEKRALARLGLVIGCESLYFPALLKPRAVALRRLLWGLAHRLTPPPAPPPGRLSVPADEAAPPGFYEALGYRLLGTVAVRVDRLERLAARAALLSRQGAFAAPPELARLVGVRDEALPAMLTALGYRASGDGDVVTYRRPPPRRRSAAPAGERRQSRSGDDSAFAALAELAGRR